GADARAAAGEIVADPLEYRDLPADRTQPVGCKQAADGAADHQCTTLPGHDRLLSLPACRGDHMLMPMPRAFANIGRQSSVVTAHMTTPCAKGLLALLAALWLATPVLAQDKYPT